MPSKEFGYFECIICKWKSPPGDGSHTWTAQQGHCDPSLGPVYYGWKMRDCSVDKSNVKWVVIDTINVPQVIDILER